MDRRELLFAAALLLAAVLVSGGLAHAVALPFEEGFEDTEAGIYPSGGIWNNLSWAMGAYVTEEEPLGGIKSFRLNSWPFAPQMEYVVLDELPDHLSYEAAVCLDATSGWEGLVGFMDRYNTTYPMWNFFCVDGSAGSVSFCGEEQVELAPYTRGNWCTVRADLNYESLTAKLWVDGELVAQGVEITPREFYYAPMGDVVTDQWGVASEATFAWSNIVYFDNLHLWESSTLLTVDIDVKPGSATNPINLGAQGVLPVSVFSSESFDATQIDPLTCELAGAPVALNGQEPMAHLEDVNGDGLLDMMLQFEIQELDPAQLSGGWAVLVGSLMAVEMTYTSSAQGEEFVGMDQVALAMHGVRTRGRGRR
jgi:hypothetical protein